MNEISKNKIMFNFLEINFPITKVKLKPKDVNFSRALIIRGVFIGGNDKYYPINKKFSKDLVAKDLTISLENVFSFNEEEAKITALNYLEKLN